MASPFAANPAGICGTRRDAGDARTQCVQVGPQTGRQQARMAAVHSGELRATEFLAGGGSGMQQRGVAASVAPATGRGGSVAVSAGVVSPKALVLVAGSTGGVGQLVTLRLLQCGYRVRALTRDLEKANELFGRDRANLEVVVGDLRNEETAAKLTKGVDAICSCVGTTAFPSSRWDGNNATEMTDKVAVGNLIKYAPKNIERFVLVSSAGVMRANQFPFNLLNVFDVLKYKRMAEENLMNTGVSYTIIRPHRLTGGPWTSYDLNTLLKANPGESRSGVQLSRKDDIGRGQALRASVAEAIVQSLHIPATENQAFSIISVPGDGPKHDTKKWEEAFTMA